jgi:hypothetical protein
MRIRFITPLIAAVGAATAIAVAPLAMAAPSGTSPTCTNTGNSTQCESPGNAQLNATPPDVPQQMYYFLPYGNAFNGFHGGGQPAGPGS